MRALTGFLVMVAMMSGCALNHKPDIGSIAQKKWKKSPRCKVLGKASTRNVAVLVERNCLRNGLTTVNMIVLNTSNKGKDAAEDGVRLITKLLGFKPVLTILFYGKAKGLPFFMCAVTGTNHS